MKNIYHVSVDVHKYYRRCEILTLSEIKLLIGIRLYCDLLLALFVIFMLLFNC